MTEQELMAKCELSTYLDGLKDAQYMSKADLQKAIKTIQESNITFEEE